MSFAPPLGSTRRRWRLALFAVITLVVVVVEVGIISPPFSSSSSSPFSVVVVEVEVAIIIVTWSSLRLGFATSVFGSRLPHFADRLYHSGYSACFVVCSVASLGLGWLIVVVRVGVRYGGLVLGSSFASVFAAPALCCPHRRSL